MRPGEPDDLGPRDLDVGECRGKGHRLFQREVGRTATGAAPDIGMQHVGPHRARPRAAGLLKVGQSSPS